MTSLKIGACLMVDQIAAHRDWLFADARDVEIQDFYRLGLMDNGWREVADAARGELAGHQGRIGIHGPFYGLDINNPDTELQPLISNKYLRGVEACEILGACQMVIHSPFNHWYHNHVLSEPGYREREFGTIHAILDPVVARASDAGVTLVIENIEDVDPFERARLMESFGSKAVAVSIDTGHAHLARNMSGAPPVDQFVRAAGPALQHVHLQDLDGHADQHWAMGDGNIEWYGVFAALSEIEAETHLVLELRDHTNIPRAFEWLRARGLAV
ncbi:MAG: sugar phosphate isomerase/epimerase family protein [Pseudomonadota bacterium]